MPPETGRGSPARYFSDRYYLGHYTLGITYDLLVRWQGIGTLGVS